MNERIEALMIKASNGSCYDGPCGVQLSGDDIKKFAELIVREMCNVLDKEQWNIGRDWICDDGTRIIPKVKEHFGVE